VEVIRKLLIKVFSMALILIMQQSQNLLFNLYL
jgi:hypothetical protein